MLKKILILTGVILLFILTLTNKPLVSKVLAGGLCCNNTDCPMGNCVGAGPICPIDYYGYCNCIDDGDCMTSSTACCGSSTDDISCGASIPIRCGDEAGPPPGCFLPGTIVNSSDGGKKIEDVQVGDKVDSFADNALRQSVVSKIYEVKRDYYYSLVAGDYQVKVTAEHPFFVGNNKFKEVKDLKAGDDVYVMESKSLVKKPVTSNTRINEKTDAYNLSVDNTQTFFANDFAVHNKGTCTGYGNFDFAGCSVSEGSGAGGWACCSNMPNYYPQIQLYERTGGGVLTLVGEVPAHRTREAAVGTACGGNANHGFVFPDPYISGCTQCTDYQIQIDNYSLLFDGAAHQIYAYGVSPNHLYSRPLNNNPITITCAAPTPTPFPCPANINKSCNGSGTQATISWDPIAAAVGYVLRLNHEPYDAPANWYNGAQGDQWQEPVSSTIDVAITPGANYEYSVQGKAPGESYPYAGGRCPFSIFNVSAPNRWGTFSFCRRMGKRTLRPLQIRDDRLWSTDKRISGCGDSSSCCPPSVYAKRISPSVDHPLPRLARGETGTED